MTKKKINLDGRKIKTRVVEERAYEGDLLVEISRNYFAICKQTNAIYYFGEWSRDCPDGFDKNDECTGEEEESNEGSWEAGVHGAMPSLIMPGTFLLGAKYFQEIAPPDAVDRAEHVAMGVHVEITIPEENDKNINQNDCVEVVDTNPGEGVCDEDDGDSKIYCPGIGLVEDKELVLVWYGYK